VNTGGGLVRDEEGGLYDGVGDVVVLYGLFVRSIGALNDGLAEAVCVWVAEEGLLVVYWVVCEPGVDLVEVVVPAPGEAGVCCHRLVTSKRFNTAGCERGKWAARSIV